MPNDAKFHLTEAAAKKYQAHSVPAMFAPLARATLEQVSLTENSRVLDVACGTGALTREIARNLPGRGQIVGCDLNQTMIDVARRQQQDTPHQMGWATADVADLPFDEAEFDYAFVQQGLQFFPDKPAALGEIRRVLKPGGQLVLTCWRAISPFNNALASALAERVSEKAAAKARAPFSFRDGDLIASLLREAGLDITVHDGITLFRRFQDLSAQVLALPIEADLREKGEAIIAQVLEDVVATLEPYDQGGVFVVPQEAHLFVATATDRPLR